MQKSYLYRIALVAALAGLLFGLDLGVISGALPFIKEHLQLSMNAEGWVVSSVLFSAAFGAIMSGWMSSAWGRKNSIIISAFLFGVGSVGSALSDTVSWLVIMRIILGFSVGMATYNAPLYLAEISPARVRGSFVTFYQFMITLGIVLAFLSDLIFTPSGNWRWMLGIIAIPAFLMFVLMFSLPKSPRWLMLKGLTNQANDVLGRLLSKQEIEAGFHDIQVSASHHENIFTLLKRKKFVAIVLFAMGLQMIQQFSGMNAILYYAPEMFAHSGYGTQTGAMWATFLIGVVNTIATIFAIKFIDRLGRRFFLYLSGIMILISTLSLGLIFVLPHQNSAALNIISLLVMFVFIIGYALGYAPVIWTLCAEVFPLNGRSFAMSCATTSNWVASGIVGAVTLPLINSLGIGYFYLILAGFAVLSLLYFKLFLPETKGVRLEQIEKNLWAGKPLRNLGDA
jgi:sugar porter (SP) family MFS transporter